MQRQPPEATAEMDAPGTSTIRQRLPATEHVPGEDRGTQLLPFWSLPIYLPMGFGLEWGGHEDAAGAMLVNDGDTILTEKGFRDRVNERLEGGVGLWVDPRWAPDPKTE
jgi:hypothetical protein